MLSRKDLNSAELETVKVSKIRRWLLLPAAKCKQKKKRPCITDIHTSGPWSETTTHQRWQTNKMQHSELRTIVVPGLSTSSSSSASPTSPTSLSHEAVIPTQHPASTRSESTSSTVRANPSHEPAETENTNKNGDNETLRGNG